MSMWKSKAISNSNIQEIEKNGLLGNLKVIHHYDGSVDITVAIDLNTMKSYVLSYKERIG